MAIIQHNKGRRASLIVPDVAGMSQREAAHAYLNSGLMPHPWRVSRGTKASCYRNFSFSTISETHDSISGWASSWRCALVVSRASGLIALDIDEQEIFEAWDFLELPLTAMQKTGRAGGGLHLLLDARDLDAASWPMQGDIPGGQIKSNGFIAVEPSLHPSGRRYKWVQRRIAPIGPLGAALAEYRSSSNGSSNGSGNDPASSNGSASGSGLDVKTLLRSGVQPGEQDSVLTALMMKLRGAGLDRDVASLVGYSVMSSSVQGVDASGARSRKGPWTVEDAGRKWDSADRKIRQISEELQGIDQPALDRADEEEFWASRSVLQHVRAWARARRCGPWAVLGECLAQAVCHVSPAFVLPSLVGGYGTLNMLLAITGASGAGKSAARACARGAFTWEGSGLIPDVIPAIPIGSGEGLVKNFGFSRRAEDGGMELVRTEYSCIVTIDEIDTFLAVKERGGSTIAPQLRQLYSGEGLGFGYADSSKRVVIPGGEYRSVVIAGVQPGRGSVIVDDVESGFSQRWLWLPSGDPGAPEISDLPVVRPLPWVLPGSAADAELDDDGGGFVVMDVCSQARSAVDSMRVHGLRRGVEAEAGEAHKLYTRLKVAGALALLCGEDSVSDSFWDLSSVVMKVSDNVLVGVRARLAAVAHEANVARGRSEGVRAAVAEVARSDESVSRVSSAVLRVVPSEGWISYGKLKNSIAARDRASIQDAINKLLADGIIMAREFEYKGQKGMKYRRNQG